jgi:hypothetical protein
MRQQFRVLNRSSGGSPRVLERGTISFISSVGCGRQPPQMQARSRVQTSARVSPTTSPCVFRRSRFSRARVFPLPRPPARSMAS